jgi:hypothetical protein
MASKVSSPEWMILARTIKRLKKAAADREFVCSMNEPVLPLNPSSVLQWKTLEGSNHNQHDGFVNIPLPSILVTLMPVKPSLTAGVNCADDEQITIVLQLVDNTPMNLASMTPIRTHIDWMNRIRRIFLSETILFKQDFDPSIADPWQVRARDRVPSDPTKLWQHDQQVAAFSFVVFVRHHHDARGGIA